MNDYKMFSTGHLFGTGNQVVIAAASQTDRQTQIEVYTFSYNDASFFKGRILRYDFDATNLVDINKELELQGNRLVNDLLFQLYTETEDPDFIHQTPELLEIPKSHISSLLTLEEHKKMLKEISQDTKCEVLRTDIETYSSFKVTIMDYKPRNYFQ